MPQNPILILKALILLRDCTECSVGHYRGFVRFYESNIRKPSSLNPRTLQLYRLDLDSLEFRLWDGRVLEVSTQGLVKVFRA